MQASIEIVIRSGDYKDTMFAKAEAHFSLQVALWQDDGAWCLPHDFHPLCL